MWKILQSTSPINEENLNSLAADGWELKMCVPYDSQLYWYLFKGN